MKRRREEEESLKKLSLSSLAKDKKPLLNVFTSSQPKILQQFSTSLAFKKLQIS